MNWYNLSPFSQWKWSCSAQDQSVVSVHCLFDLTCASLRDTLRCDLREDIISLTRSLGTPAPSRDTLQCDPASTVNQPWKTHCLTDLALFRDSCVYRDNFNLIVEADSWAACHFSFSSITSAWQPISLFDRMKSYRPSYKTTNLPTISLSTKPVIPDLTPIQAFLLTIHSFLYITHIYKK